MDKYSRSSGPDDWLTALVHQQRCGNHSVLVTVLQTRGSTPREVSTKMLVTQTSARGTIGGGHLEYKVIEMARAFLTEADAAAPRQPLHQRHRIPLSASLGQCCGGHVEILLEKIGCEDTAWVDAVLQEIKLGRASIVVNWLRSSSPQGPTPLVASKLVVSLTETTGTLGCSTQDAIAIKRARSMLESQQSIQVLLQDELLYNPVGTERPVVVLFGAGHVGQAIVQQLHAIPCHIRWIDTRADLFAESTQQFNVQQIISDDPAAEIDTLPSGSFVLVMTHKHQLDYLICERALKRSDLAFIGLIGSMTKRRRFLHRLKSCGLEANALNRLTCPIGVEGVTGKLPAQIAVATVAQLLQQFEIAQACFKRDLLAS